ncbi:hypothetical protein ACUR5C_02695 [Aliikangiella sp. IMCC44653]
MRRLLTYALATPVYGPMILMLWGATLWVPGLVFMPMFEGDFSVVYMFVPIILGYFGLMAAIDLVEFLSANKDSLDDYRKTYLGMVAGIIAIGFHHYIVEPSILSSLLIELPPIIASLTIVGYVERKGVNQKLHKDAKGTRLN